MAHLVHVEPSGKAYTRHTVTSKKRPLGSTCTHNQDRESGRAQGSLVRRLRARRNTLNLLGALVAIGGRWFPHQTRSRPTCRRLRSVGRPTSAYRPASP